MFIIMASPISTPTTSCSYSIPTCSKPSLFASLSSISYTTSPKNGVFTLNSLLGFASFSQWSGLKHLGISVTPKLIIKRRTMRFNGKTVRASLFGVGVPEALVIGVVALLVFGPKGLAEVARNLGKTLREFQPTIRELQDVSREFKSTLEREIGLDEISSQSRNMYVPKDTTGSTSSSVGSSENESTVDDPNGAASPKRAYTTEEYLKLTEEQLKVTAAQGEGQTPSTSEEPQLETQSGAEVDVKQSADTMPQPQKPENEVS